MLLAPDLNELPDTVIGQHPFEGLVHDKVIVIPANPGQNNDFCTHRGDDAGWGKNDFSALTACGKVFRFRNNMPMGPFDR